MTSSSRFPFFRRTSSTSARESFEPKSWTGFNRSRPECEPLVPFAIDERVAWRFNAYAKFAFPSEIGGMLRIVGDEKDGYRAIDLKIFPHTVANGSYFELDGEAISTFLMDLVRQGRRDEVGEWRGILHDHPGFHCAMSGTDRTNLLMLASDQLAFSLICSAYPDTDRNYHLVHWAQPKPLPMVVSNVVPVSANGGSLAGLGDLTDEELDAIRAEVDAVLPKNARWQSRYTRERDCPTSYSLANEPVAPRLPFVESDVDPLGLSDDEYVVCDAAIDQALQECGKGRRRRVEQLLDLRLDIDHQNELSATQRTLLVEVLTAFASCAAMTDEAETVGALVKRLDGSEEPTATQPDDAPVDVRSLLAKDETKALCRRGLQWAQGRSERSFSLRLFSVGRALDEERSLSTEEADALQAALELWLSGAKLKPVERVAATAIRRALLDLL